MPSFPAKLLIFGCGNMGGAMLTGWIAGGVDPARFVVVDPAVSDLPDGVIVHRAAAEVGHKFNAVLIGVKPQMIGDLAAEIAPLLKADAILISILAGTEIATLSSYFPTARIVRLMPNLAAAIGRSPLGLYSSALDEAERTRIEAILGSLGTAVWMDSEDQMNAVTALAGSGPAFVYRFLDALAKAGVNLGLPKDISAKLALSMVEGAALLAAQSVEEPASLAARVTSPGGTTAAGLAVLDDEDALAGLVEATLRAAAERGAELAQTLARD